MPTPGSLVLDKVPQESRPCVKCHMDKGITGSAIRDWQLSKRSEVGVACANCQIPVKEAVVGIMSSASACEDKKVRRGLERPGKRLWSGPEKTSKNLQPPTDPHPPAG